MIQYNLMHEGKQHYIQQLLRQLFPIEEYWNREGEKYWKGVWSKVGGTGEDMLECVIERNDGSIEKVVWDASGKWGKTVWNAAGEVIEKVGDLFPDLDWPPDWWPF